MTQTEKNLTKMIQQAPLTRLESELRTIKNDLKAKEYVLSNKDKLPRQEMITSIEERYKLDFKKFRVSNTCSLDSISASVTSKASMGLFFTIRVVLKWRTPSL